MVSINDIPIYRNAGQNDGDREADDNRIDDFYPAFAVDCGHLVEEAVDDRTATGLLTDGIKQVTGHDERVKNREGEKHGVRLSGASFKPCQRRRSESHPCHLDDDCLLIICDFLSLALNEPGCD